MKSNKSLIIDLRSQLHWHQRMLSDVFTAVLWGVWFYLWRPIAGLIAWLHHWTVLVRPTSAKFMLTGVISIEGLMAVFGAAGTLMLWSLLPKRGIARQPVVNTVDDAAAYFHLPVENIEQGQQANICRVHHDECGRIVRIETQR